MNKAGEESEMKMLADAEMMLGKGHEMLFLLRVPSPANQLPGTGPSGIPFWSSLSMSNLFKKLSLAMINLKVRLLYNESH
jgi:hypothetical protein